MEVSVPLAALSERTNSHNLGMGAERHLGSGFGSIRYESIHESGVTLGSFEQWYGQDEEIVSVE